MGLPGEGVGRGAGDKRRSETGGVEVGKSRTREMAEAGPGDG